MRESAVLVRAPLLPRPPTQNVDYGACASVSWPCMCVSARFEGLLQRVCVRVSCPRATPLSSNARLLQGLLQCVCVCQQSSCSSSHGPPFSPPASPPLTARASRESAQSTRRAWPGKTHALGGCGRTGSTGVPPGKQLRSSAERNAISQKFDLLLLLIVTQPQNAAAVITYEHSSLTGEHRGTSAPASNLVTLIVT